MLRAGPNRNSMNQRGNGVTQGKNQRNRTRKFSWRFTPIKVNFRTFYRRQYGIWAFLSFASSMCFFEIVFHELSRTVFFPAAFILRMKWIKLVPKTNMRNDREIIKSLLNFDNVSLETDRVCIMQIVNNVVVLVVVKLTTHFLISIWLCVCVCVWCHCSFHFFPRSSRTNSGINYHVFWQPICSLHSI